MGKKKYSSDNLIVSDDVIASVVTEAVKDIEGFDGFCKKPVTISNLKTFSGNLKFVNIRDNQLDYDIEVFISVKKGYSVGSICQSVQRYIKDAVELMTGKRVNDVEVNVVNVNIDAPKKQI